MQPEDIIRLKEQDSVVTQHKLTEEQNRLVVHVERLLRLRTKQVSLNNISLLERIIKQLEK
jgi:hypothetical protein